MSDLFVRIVDAPGNLRQLARLKDAGDLGRRSMRHAWFELGKDLRDRANREILRKPKGGRTYVVRMRGGRVRRHVASAPGETHANLTGDLRKSIGWKVTGETQLDFGYGVSTRTASPRYDEYVEYGTRRMEPRPSLRNAIGGTDREVSRGFEESMTRFFGGLP